MYRSTLKSFKSYNRKDFVPPRYRHNYTNYTKTKHGSPQLLLTHLCKVWSHKQANQTRIFDDQLLDRGIYKMQVRGKYDADLCEVDKLIRKLSADILNMLKTLTDVR